MHRRLNGPAGSNHGFRARMIRAYRLQSMRSHGRLALQYPIRKTWMPTIYDTKLGTQGRRTLHYSAGGRRSSKQETLGALEEAIQSELNTRLPDLRDRSGILAPKCISITIRGRHSRGLDRCEPRRMGVVFRTPSPPPLIIVKGTLTVQERERVALQRLKGVADSGW